MMTLSPGVHLVIGGARSGKSTHAEMLAMQCIPPWIYLATSKVLDKEMAERVSLHRKRRGKDWRTIEEPVKLVEAIRTATIQGNVVLVDCITMWITNILLSNEHKLNEELEHLLSYLGNTLSIPVIVVSNEVGLGIVPENELARMFRDFSGITNQRLAFIARTVTWLIAGIPLVIKNGTIS